MIKRFLEWSKQFIPLGDFIGVAFGTARITMAACLTILIFLDVLN
jgi:hypothetical protein